MLKADKTLNLNGVIVNEYLLTNHNVNKISMPTSRMNNVIGVTVHNTDDLDNVNDDAEQYTRATANGNMKSTRVHYYVDDVCAWQNLPLNLTSWHAADGSGNGNMKTISIECIMSKNYNDKDKKSEDNCARLTAYLLHKYGLNAEDNLFTHTHWLNVKDGKKGTNDYLNTARHYYKYCPAYILPHWNDFKAKVKKYLSELNGNTSSSMPDSNLPYRVKILDDCLNIRKNAGIGSQIVNTIKDHGVYTIVAECSVNGVKWGKLKSGAGWISLHQNYVKKI